VLNNGQEVLGNGLRGASAQQRHGRTGDIRMNAGEPIQFTDPDFQTCPFPAYRRLLAEAPVYRDPVTGHYVVTQYDAVKQIAADAQRFSNRCGILGEIEGPRKAIADRILAEHGLPIVDVLVSGDPPEHRFHRSLIDKVFSLARVRKMEGYIQLVVDETIDAFIERGTVDFFAAAAKIVPVKIIADQMGVPRSDLATFRRWSDAAVARIDPSTDQAQFTQALLTYCESQRYFVQKAQEYRLRPADCLLSDMVHAESDDGKKLSLIELLAIAQLLIIAGNETTTNAMSSAMLRLAEDPDLQGRLRADPALIPAFIEEALRLEAPIQGLFRRATQDVEVCGTKIPAESIIMVRWGAANRDPTKFAHPDDFDCQRTNARQHLTFGAGAHFCVGSQLARGELRIVFETVLKRMRNIRLAKDSSAVVHKPSYINYGLSKLQIDFEVGA
jgi:cytochrome P450